MEIRPGFALAAFVAALLAVGFSAAYASQPAPGTAYDQQQQAPKDCKMKPEDPRCKDEPKG
ncbi:MAG TPA: hypothetical protein VFB53_02740 [Burkholderiales bacterium]|nr:hypothetical protein [Burkholderiales bacterium]